MIDLASLSLLGFKLNIPPQGLPREHCLEYIPLFTSLVTLYLSLFFIFFQELNIFIYFISVCLFVVYLPHYNIDSIGEGVNPVLFITSSPTSVTIPDT